MEIFLKEFGKMEILLKGKQIIIMEIFLKEILKMEKKMALELKLIIMEKFIKVVLQKEKNKKKDLLKNSLKNNS